ncbi:sigma-54-dependent Fis family transcriptional regulator [Oscillospiraceae bacterium]|nr:sigma-54-dependent Fis family transcriptional regulator [Oscillospiraceae bacterium]
MEPIKEKQFLVVAPEEAQKVQDFQGIEPYIYRVILSKPCPELLEQVAQAMRETKIYGILTRGSLAQYLYANHVPAPIFHLKYELYTILDLLSECVALGYHNICIFEIGYNTPGSEPSPKRTRVSLEGCELFYYKLYDRGEAEQEIRELHAKNQVDVVVGDVEPILIARRLGIPYRNFIIDEYCYMGAVDEARYSTDIALKEKAQNDFIEVMTNIISEAVVIVDKLGIIRTCNLQAERLLLRGEGYADVKGLLDCDMETLLTLPANYLLTVRERNYVLNIVPRTVGREELYALVLNSVNYVENLEISIRRQNKERGLTAKMTFEDIVCQDPASRRLVSIAKKYARSNGTIIIRGETGTGKEVIASSIHNESARADGPFVAINCAVFNENLIESELFGYEKGAFTGALSSGKRGLFELAHRGSLFLDEVGELPLSLQAKLLRVLQEKEIMRVGGDKIIPVDVRVIAATNKDLKKMVRQGEFREDLYYRLALLEVEIPPLRERREDIVPLFTSFLADAAERENRAIYWEDVDVFTPILDYDWPGNVRELRNFSERVVLLCEDYRLSRPFIEELVRQKRSPETGPQYVCPVTNDLKALERDYIAFLLRFFGGDKDKLCAYLHMSKTTLWRKLNEA